MLITQFIKLIFRKYFQSLYYSTIGLRKLKKLSLSNKIYPNTKSKEIIIYNTAINSSNLGDDIIVYFCKKFLCNTFTEYKFKEISTHKIPTKSEFEALMNAKAVIVCGSNFLSPTMENYSEWKFKIKLSGIPNFILLGAGMGIYGEITPFSKLFYSKLLVNKYLHSVRDEYTQAKLNEIGIENVINTGCMSMYSLQEKCNSIPCKKAKQVVTTVSHFIRKKERDFLLFDILKRNYEKIYFWPQGENDYKYVRKYFNDKVIFLDRSLSAYENCLKNNDVDYVGIRLHGGIFALNHMRRSIIIAIDNRATEISKDTNLPIVYEKDIKSDLENMINNEWETNIKINKDNWEIWNENLKNQLGI